MASIEITFSGRIGGTYYKDAKAVLYGGNPLSVVPKSYKEIGTIRHSLGNNYNSSIATIYMTPGRRGTLKYSIYRDGCFSPYYGTFVITKSI